LALGTERNLTDIKTVTRLIEPEVEALGYELVRVAMIGGTSDPTLQVMAERPDTRQLGLSDCEQISRRLSEVLDALESEGRDPIDGAYRLEVSSPGIDRPLTRLKDYRDWAGFEARIALIEPKASRKQYSGTLEGLTDETVKLLGNDGQTYEVAFSDIASAKLLLTDKLIKATAPLSTEGAEKIEVDPRPADQVDEKMEG
jgi:ribosome maturation factor RimP